MPAARSDETPSGRLEPFSDFVERCLYDPVDGFYGSGRGRSGGRSGDFITSPEVGPLFGAVIASAVDRWWHESGRPDPFPVVDLGAGPGGLIRAMELAAPPCSAAWRLVGVDRAGSPELPPVDGGVVIANELLDNVPFDIGLRADDGDASLWVGRGASGTPEPVWRPQAAPFGFEAPVGRPFPVVTRAAALLDDLVAAGPVRIVAFDYGMSTTAELADRGGWLRTYRQHERGDDPFVSPGEWDITTDLPVDQLPEPTVVRTQAEFLAVHGIEDLVDEGRSYWSAHAAAPDLAAIRMRSRIREAEALLDPDGLGGFLCMEWVGEARSRPR